MRPRSIPSSGRQIRFAGELVMPVERVKWLLDGKGVGEMINLDFYAKNFQEHFGTSRAQMEKRLVDLGYLLTRPNYEWADYSKRRERHRLTKNTASENPGRPPKPLG